MEKIYKFNSIQDLVNLAKEVEDSVRYKDRFDIIIDGIKLSMSYECFWEFIAPKIHGGATGVLIDGDNIKILYT